MSKPIRCANNQARTYVNSRTPFTGSNLFSEEYPQGYVVFSYGRHHPLFIFRDGLWYENSDKYSSSTSRHRVQARPNSGGIQERTTGEMLTILASVVG